MDISKYLKTSDLARLLGVTRQAAQQMMEKLETEGIATVNIGQSKAIAKKDLPQELADRIQAAQKEATEKVLRSSQQKSGKKYLEYEKELWSAADKLRGSVDPSEYKHIVLGLLFLKYISDSYNQRREELESELSDSKMSDEARSAVLEDKDQYRGKGVFYVPEKARWSYLQKKITQGGLAGLIDEAMEVLEDDNPVLAGVLFKEYTKANLEDHTLEELINIFSKIDFDHQGEHGVQDNLGKVYEYFLGQFADSEGRRGGEFYTPTSLVRLLVEILQPYEGARMFDPACGSGGMFVQSGKFLHEHHQDSMKLVLYGQESNQTTLRLGKMNLAVRGVAGDLKLGNSYYDDKFPNLKADFVLANPPFNSEWNPDMLPEGDPRIQYGKPPGSNANFLWIQHFLHHLAPNGMAGFVMANGALNVEIKKREGEIRKKIIQDDLVEVIVACPPKLFSNVTLPVSLWFLVKNKKADRFKDRSGKVLFIDARNTFHVISRKQVEFTAEDTKKISDTVRAWRGEGGEYEDVPGFCKSATLEEIEKAGFVLTPGRYVGVPEEEDDGVPFKEKVEKLTAELESYFAQSTELEEKIQRNLQAFRSNNE